VGAVILKDSTTLIKVKGGNMLVDTRITDFLVQVDLTAIGKLLKNDIDCLKF